MHFAPFSFNAFLSTFCAIQRQRWVGASNAFPIPLLTECYLFLAYFKPKKGLMDIRRPPKMNEHDK